MKRKSVDATNAWRMRRTRGDIGLLRLLAAAARVGIFLAEGLLPAGLPGFAVTVGDWLGADLWITALRGAF